MNVKVNRDGSERITYDEAGIPIYIREGRLSGYPEYRALCHWHEEVEFIYIADGSMSYYINGKSIFLNKGDSLMVNAGRLHYGYSNRREECLFYCMLLHPSLITDNRKLQQRYIEPVTRRESADYLLFAADGDMGEWLQAMYRCKTEAVPAYELEVIGLFHAIWRRVYEMAGRMSAEAVPPMEADLLALRQMVSYIYRNYTGSITLEDIASVGHVCRSKCCRIFQKYVRQSPMDFVNTYRLECSRQLLASTSLSVTEVCMNCGFNHLSYFSRQFRSRYGCSPREYRKSDCSGNLR